MSYSYRLSRFAAVGWIATACVLGSAGAGLAYVEGMKATGRVDSHIHPPVNSDDRYQPSKYRAEKHPEPRIVEAKQSPDDAATSNGAKNSNHKNEIQEADRGTIAAETQARYAIFQTGIALLALIFSAVGTGLLIWTLCETRKTAKASVASAKQARAAVRIAREAFKASEAAAKESAENVKTALSAANTTVDQFQRIADATLLQAKSFMLDRRPILYPINGVVKLSHGHHYIIEIDVLNIGTSIGFIKNINTKILQRVISRSGEQALDESVIDDTYFIRDEAVVRLGRPIGKMIIYPDVFDEVVKNRIIVIVKGSITYVDSFERRWISSFRFEFVAKNRDGGKLAWSPNGWSNEEVKDEDAKS